MDGLNLPSMSAPDPSATILSFPGKRVRPHPRRNWAAKLPDGVVKMHGSWKSPLLTAAENAFILQMTLQHRNGLATARQALKAGADAELLQCVQLKGAEGPDELPRLFFGVRGCPGWQMVVTARAVAFHNPPLWLEGD